MFVEDKSRHIKIIKAYFLSIFCTCTITIPQQLSASWDDVKRKINHVLRLSSSIIKNVYYLSPCRLYTKHMRQKIKTYSTVLNNGIIQGIQNEYKNYYICLQKLCVMYIFCILGMCFTIRRIIYIYIYIRRWNVSAFICK